MSNKLMFLVVAVLLVLMIGLAAGFFMMWSKISNMNTQANMVANTETGSGQTTAPGTLFSLDTFIVNLADQERNRYLRVTMDLELVAPTDVDKLNERLPQVRDLVLMILPSKRFEDIASMEGKMALRSEVINKLNSLFAKSVISNIYFTEFVVQ